MKYLFFCVHKVRLIAVKGAFDTGRGIRSSFVWLPLPLATDDKGTRYDPCLQTPALSARCRRTCEGLGDPLKDLHAIYFRL